jgi:hypothetical protein
MDDGAVVVIEIQTFIAAGFSRSELLVAPHNHRGFDLRGACAARRFGLKVR